MSGFVFMEVLASVRGVERVDRNALEPLGVRRLHLRRALRAELRTRDDALDQAVETIAVALELHVHLLERWFVRKHEAATERVGEELAAEIVDEIVLAMLAHVGAQALQARTFGTAGKNRAGVDSASAEIADAAFADGAVAF